MNKRHYQVDLSYLEEFNSFLSMKPFINKVVKIKIKNKTIKYQFYNQLATCVLRIRETTNYINQKELIKINECGQAFDFYELINLISIILGCIETLFDILSAKFPMENFLKNAIFKISNQTKLNDLQFFKFIRSASSVHPAKTTSFRGKTKRLNEVFPYAIWVNSSALRDRPKGCDLELWAWSSRTKSKTIYYYLCSDEFYKFLQGILEEIKTLIPILKVIRTGYLKNTCFKKIRSESSFTNYSNYLLYLYRRLKKYNQTDDFFDAGLAIASGIFNNHFISDEFKCYLKDKIPYVVNKLKSNPEEVDDVNIFNDLNTYECFEVINKDRASYVNEKFWDYLYREAKNEILHKNKRLIENAKANSMAGDNALWAYALLSTDIRPLFQRDELKIAKTFEDLFELTLQAVYFFWKQKN